MLLRSTKGSLMVTTSTLPELKAVLVTRYPIRPNPFTLTLPIVSQGCDGTALEDAAVCRVQRSPEPIWFLIF